MDLMDLAYLEEVHDDYDGMQPVRTEARTFRPRRTQYFFDSCTDYEFVRNLRFTKIGAIHLTEVLEAELASSTRGGCPLTPQDTVIVSLNILGGGHFLRTGALIVNISCSAAGNALGKFCEAVNKVIKPQVLHLPDLETMYRTSQKLLKKYNLPDFAFAIDGVYIFFDDKPRGIPQDRITQAFFGRKLRYAVNAMVIGLRT